MEVKVVKFGGSSLANANQFRKVAEIVKAENDRAMLLETFKSPENVFREMKRLPTFYINVMTLFQAARITAKCLLKFLKDITTLSMI